jgi:serine protease
LRTLLRLLSVVAATPLLLLATGSPAAADTTSNGGHQPHVMPQVGIQPPAIDVCQILPTCPPGAAAGQPEPVNMAYFGGHVQVKPQIYLVLWGWGEPGAFSAAPTGGNPSYDPQGVGARMSSFLAAIGGTPWAGVPTQFYEQASNGQIRYIQNPKNQLAGVWWDNSDPIHNNLSGLELAQEAQRAVAHFNVTDLDNSQFVIAQPQNYDEAGFNGGAGYCAWHDYTQPQYYPGVEAGISFTNMPYVLNMGYGCGQDFVNPSPQGDLDGVTIVLGHEVEETVTDPGAEDYINGVELGGWFDWQGWENGDKCAWVGDGLTMPGSPYDLTGNDGQQYAVQDLWSNVSLNGVGYCAPH